MSVAFISHPDCLLHGAGIEHPEKDLRISAIQDALVEYQLAPVLTYYEAPLVEREFLNVVHAKEYVDMVYSITPAIDDVWLDPDTFMTAGSLTAALRAAGANTLAIDLLMEQKQSAYSVRCDRLGTTLNGIVPWDFVYLIMSLSLRRMPE